MKKPLSLLIAAVLCSVANAETPAKRAETLYRQGIAAEQAGDAVSAKNAFAEALRANPKHANAEFRLRQLKITGPAIAAKGREAKLGAVAIPLIRLEDASLQESIDALGMMIEKESKGELAPNFVIQDPQGKLGEARITLSLKSVPAKGVLDYILTQSGAKARFDEHAVVIVPR